MPRDQPLADDDPRALMSALADGDADALSRACTLFRDDAGARAAWHAYHLIGDVLRSEDLAHPAARDADFLAALRVRLAAEPALLAPTPAAASPSPSVRRRQHWLVPAAAAAGFMAVAGVLVVTRLSSPDGAAPQLAALPAGAVAPAPALSNVRVIRDAQLDGYLQAHLEARGGGSVAMPGSASRKVEMTTISTPLSGASGVAPAGPR